MKFFAHELGHNIDLGQYFEIVNRDRTESFNDIDDYPFLDEIEEAGVKYGMQYLQQWNRENIDSLSAKFAEFLVNNEKSFDALDRPNSVATIFVGDKERKIKLLDDEGECLNPEEKAECENKGKRLAEKGNNFYGKYAYLNNQFGQKVKYQFLDDKEDNDEHVMVAGDFVKSVLINEVTLSSSLDYREQSMLDTDDEAAVLNSGYVLSSKLGEVSADYFGRLALEQYLNDISNAWQKKKAAIEAFVFSFAVGVDDEYEYEGNDNQKHPNLMNITDEHPIASERIAFLFSSPTVSDALLKNIENLEEEDSTVEQSGSTDVVVENQDVLDTSSSTDHDITDYGARQGRISYDLAS